MFKQVTFNLELEQINELQKVANSMKINKSELIRKGVDLVLENEKRRSESKDNFE